MVPRVHLRDAAQAGARPRDLQVVERRSPRGPEVFALLADAVVVRCLDGDGPGSIEFAMSPDTLTGFLAWLESSPPGMPDRLTAVACSPAADEGEQLPSLAQRWGQGELSAVDADRPDPVVRRR